MKNFFKKNLNSIFFCFLILLVIVNFQPKKIEVEEKKFELDKPTLPSKITFQKPETIVIDRNNFRNRPLLQSSTWIQYKTNRSEKIAKELTEFAYEVERENGNKNKKVTFDPEKHIFEPLRKIESTASFIGTPVEKLPNPRLLPDPITLVEAAAKQEKYLRAYRLYKEYEFLRESINQER